MNKIVNILLFIFISTQLTGCTSGNTLNTSVEFFFTLLGYAIVFFIGVSLILLILSIINNLPQIIVGIIWFLVIMSISIIVLGITLIFIYYLGYFIFYKIFWLHTTGIYRVGGVILSFLIWTGILIYIANSPFGKACGNLFESMFSTGDKIHNIDDIYSFFNKWKDKHF